MNLRQKLKTQTEEVVRLQSSVTSLMAEHVKEVSDLRFSRHHDLRYSRRIRSSLRCNPCLNKSPA